MTDNNEKFKYVGFCIRLCAFIIDVFLYSIVMFIIIPILGFFFYSMDYNSFTNGGLISVLSSFFFIFSSIYYYISVAFAFAVILFWIYYQATPGKMAIGGKIVDAQTGNKPSKAQFISRYLAFFLLSVPIFGIGIFWVAFDRKKQGWHDKLAGTVVIKEKKYVQVAQFKNDRS